MREEGLQFESIPSVGGAAGIGGGKEKYVEGKI